MHKYSSPLYLVIQIHYFTHSFSSYYAHLRNALTTGVPVSARQVEFRTMRRKEEEEEEKQEEKEEDESRPEFTALEIDESQMKKDD